jgi:hypothetical protein
MTFVRSPLSALHKYLYTILLVESIILINFNTDKIIIVYFPRFAGGKFLINCLGMSRHAVLSNRRLAEAEFPEFRSQFNPRDLVDSLILTRLNLGYYQGFKLESVLDTLPKNKSLMHYWTSYEYGCQQLYGVPSKNYHQMSVSEFRNQSFNEIITTLSYSDKTFFLVTHNVKEIDIMKQVWPKARILKLRNFDKFQKLTSSLKNNRVTVTADLDTVCDWSFNVDAYFSRDKFLHAISDLYQGLSFSDFPENQIMTFWKRYTELHGID